MSSIQPHPEPAAPVAGNAEAHYRLMVEGAGEAMVLLDPVADRYLQVNAAACRLLDYDRDTLLHLPISVVHGHELAALVVFTQSILERGRGWTNELSCRTRQGKRVAVEIAATAVAPGPWIVALIKEQSRQRYWRDEARAHRYLRGGLEEWRKIETIFQEIERDNQLILHAAGEGIYGLDAEGNTTFLNPAAARMLGWRAEELIGRSMHLLIHHAHADGEPYAMHQCPIYAAFQDGLIHRSTSEVFWRKDGSAFPVEYTSTPIIDRGQLMGAVVVFRDISERKLAEQRLRSALEEVSSLKKRLELENAYLQEEIHAEHNHHEIIGNSQAIRTVIHQIELVAPTDATVLISGESGTGKELIARAIHAASQRRAHPLIRVNCAAIPHELFESEFFGHVRGAFTGAVKDRTGRFELADGGTLFLDEVGEIPLGLQGKLLRVLQEGQFERVGEERTRQVDVRVIAATNRDLRQEVQERRFREDLYFRLNVFPIESVALRERRDDIPLLATHFINHACQRLRMPGLRLSRAEAERLQAYAWPGNIRELQNVIERAVIVSQAGRLRLDLPGGAPAPAAPASMDEAGAPQDREILSEAELRALERDNLLRALNACDWKLFGAGGAAELLGVKPTTLASRIKRFGLQRR